MSAEHATASGVGAQKADPILVIDEVRKSFGGLTAVDVTHLEVQRGTITALIGPNGAGKTSLFNVLTGFDSADRGRVSFDGRDVSRWSAHRIARNGMVRTFQLTKTLSRLTVLENMKLAAPGQRGEHVLPALIAPWWRAQESASEERARELLSRFSLDRMVDEMAGTLSGGQRKLLEMARALMVEPRMIMLDEPMAGVNPALAQSLLGHITGLRDDLGMTVMFVEHDMDVVMEISDWIVVLAEGRVIAEGEPAAIRANPAVIDAYLGMQHGERAGEA